jgi:hypothetical protein
MPTVQGHITIVQEQRFRLATAGGQVLLLTLTHNAPISHAGLVHLRDSGALVRVTYTGDPNTASAAAQAVELV